jgi:hypothetical protein
MKRRAAERSRRREPWGLRRGPWAPCPSWRDLRFGVFGTLLVVGGGCGSDGAVTDSPNASNEDTSRWVRLACERRRTLDALRSTACASCIGLASAEACTCNAAPESGRCAKEVAAIGREADCSEDVRRCRGQCDDLDCDCIDRCYAIHPTCRSAVGLYDDCLVRVCGASCRQEADGAGRGG